MWWLLRQSILKANIPLKASKRFNNNKGSSGGKKIIIGIIASTGLSFACAIAYGKYDPNFRSIVKENIPYVSYINKLLLDEKNNQKSDTHIKTGNIEEKAKDDALSANLLKKKLEREKSSEINFELATEPQIEQKCNSVGSLQVRDDRIIDESNIILKSESEPDAEPSIVKEDLESYENVINYTIEKLQKTLEDSIIAQKDAANAVKLHTEKLYEALDLSDGKNSDLVWKEAKKSVVEKEKALKIAKQKSDDTKALIKKLDMDIQKLQDKDSGKFLLKIGKQQISKHLTELKQAESEILVAEEGSKTASEYQQLHLDFEKAVENRVSSLKQNLEAECHQQLLRQVAAHADHLQEVLKVKEEELERKHALEMEEKLLHQKGLFVSEISRNMAKLKEILEYLESRNGFDKFSKTAQTLFLACQAMNYKITLDKSENLSPLARDVAVVKNSAEDNDFINSVLCSIPTEAVNRGVYTNEVLQTRFQNVKNVCRKVSLIDENNDSLYRYFISYLQSILVVDDISIPKEELESKVAVDPSEWDTFDILNRISHCLKINAMEQALRYANLLQGEPRAVAKDWMDEMRLHLETQLAIKALLAYTVGVSVQACH